MQTPIQAMPNGSVENERGFSALNRLMNRLRNALQSYHLNVVLVLHNQKDKLLAPYPPVIMSSCSAGSRARGGKQQVLQMGQVPLLTTQRPVVHSKVPQLQAVPLQVVLVQVAQLQVAV